LVLRADEQWVSPRQQYWLVRMDHELPNISSAVEYSLAQPGQVEHALRLVVTPWRIYTWAHGGYSRGRQWSARVLAVATEPTALHARALLLASFQAVYQNDHEAGRAYLQQGRVLAQRTGDPIATVHARYAEGVYGALTNDLPGAIAALDQALPVAAGLPEVNWQLDVLLVLAVCYQLLGEHDRALACHEQVLTVTEPRGEAFYRSWSLWALGVAAWQHDDLDRSADLQRQAMRLKRVTNDRLGVAFCLEALAAVAAGQGRSRRAATLLGAADTLWQFTGSTAGAGQDHLFAFHEQCERQARQALGEAAYRTAFHYGAQMSQTGMDEAIAYALEEHQPQRPPAPAPVQTPLTRREWQVAELIGQGLANEEIGSRLLIPPRTVGNDAENIRVKLGLTHRSQIASWVAEQQHSNNAPPGL
jgi:DNA-binding CsgD family transcriptional regulator